MRATDDGLRAQIEAELTAVVIRRRPARGRPGSRRVGCQKGLRGSGIETCWRERWGELLVESVCTGEPMRHDVLTRLSAMQDSTAMTTYYQPSTAIGLALHWAGDLEAARPLLERAAQRALSRGEEWDRLGILLELAQLEWDAGDHQLAEQHRHAAEDALGEFAEGLLWLVDLDARYALDRGNLAVARAKVEQGSRWRSARRASGTQARLTELLASVELAVRPARAAHALLEEARRVAGVERLRPRRDGEDHRVVAGRRGVDRDGEAGRGRAGPGRIALPRGCSVMPPS